MFRVAVSQLEAGMVLAAPVRNPAKAHHVLLNTGYHMAEDMIARLQSLGVTHVWTRHPGFDFLDDRLNADIPQAREKVYENIKRNFSNIAGKAVGAFDPIEYRKVISDMILSLVADDNHAVWAERLLDGDHELFAHCSNVAYLSLVIGMRLKNYIYQQRKYVTYLQGTDLTNLGVGGVLHDLGKLDLDSSYHGLHVLDDGADSDEYRSHAERGYRMTQGRVEATASQVLLHHHQRFDGAGFPNHESWAKGLAVKQMQGHNIHIFCRIVAVANAIDASISAHKKRNSPMVAALAELQRPAFAGMFDPQVLDAALRAIPPFPIGACVDLSNGRQAVVVDVNGAQPVRPKVRLFHADPDDSSEDYEELDLSASGAPSVVRIDELVVHPEALYTLPRKSIH